MKTTFFLFFFVLICGASHTQDLPLLKVDESRNYIVDSNNKPFFWLGGTAWELIHRLNREEVDFYLEDRAKKGFTVIQTVILAELDGLRTPNAYGHLPLFNMDPEKLNEQYFEHVDYILNKAESLGMYVGLLPTWGDKFNLKWGAGPEIFTPENAGIYCKKLATRYKKQSNIIWILGGDRDAEKEIHFDIINAMAAGLKEGGAKQLITYHPVGAKMASDYFNEKWLDLEMFQSGHNSMTKEYEYVLKGKKIQPERPVINGEARYENIGDRFWENKSYGWLDDFDVRVSAYWTMLAGAAGYTYGCNDIWQMYDVQHEPVVKARTGWKPAVDLPGSTHMKILKDLFMKFPWYNLKMDQSFILNENPKTEAYMISAKGPGNEFLLIYTPMGKTIKADLSGMGSEPLKAYWFNPRSGKYTLIGEYNSGTHTEFTPWSDGRGSDFLLVVVKAENDVGIE